MTSAPLVHRFNKAVFELEEEKAFEYAAMASELAKRGVKIISFGIGQPDFQTPEHVVEEAVRALKAGFTRYVPPPGIPELREAIAEHASEFTGTGDIRPEEVMVLPGAKPGLFFTITAFVGPGDEVIVPDPGFPIYESVVRYAGGRPVFCELKAEEDFRMKPEHVQELITGRTKMIILNSPHNPTGAMCHPSDIKGILELAQEKGIIVLSDEVYDHYVYGEVPFKSVLSDPDWRDFVIYVNSFSKTWSMTGWRLGYVIADREVVKRLSLMAVNSYSCTCSFVQKAGVAALRGPMDFFKEVLSEYRRRRDLAVKLLSSIPGVEVKPAPGTFYLFPSVKEILAQTGLSTEELAIRVLKSKGVVMLPGVPGFPLKAGEGHLRFSYVVKPELIKEGVERFKEAVEELLSAS